MGCPRCEGLLRLVQAGEVAVDVCDGCGGIWLDRFELGRLDEGALPASDASARVELEPRVGCPRCEGVVMMRRHASPAREAIVDECPGCGGLWLDAGELAAARAAHAETAARRAADAARAPRIAELAPRPMPQGEAGADELDTLARVVRGVFAGLRVLGAEALDLR